MGRPRKFVPLTDDELENEPSVSIQEQQYVPKAATQRKANLPVDLKPTAQITTNKAGGSQSYLPAQFRLLPPHALTLVARVLSEGEQRYGAWNWHHIPTDDHINHLLGHTFGNIAGDLQEAEYLTDVDPELMHLVKAATRALFAVETYYLNKLVNE